MSNDFESKELAASSSSSGKRKSQSNSPNKSYNCDERYRLDENNKISFRAADKDELKVRESTHKTGNWRDRLTNTPRQLFITPNIENSLFEKEIHNDNLDNESIVVLSHLDDKGRLRSKTKDDNSLKSLLENERLMDADEQEMQFANVVIKNKYLLVLVYFLFAVIYREEILMINLMLLVALCLKPKLKISNN